MPIVEVWIAMGEDGLYGVGNDEDTAIENLVDESGDDLAGSMCRVVKLNITMSLPQEPHDDGPEIDVTITDDVGRTGEVETD